MKIPDFANFSRASTDTDMTTSSGTVPTGTLGPETALPPELESLSQEEKAIGFLQWIMKRESAVIKLAFGDWKLTPGQYEKPWWYQMLTKVEPQDLLAMEMRTRPCSGDKFVDKPPYTIEQLEEHVKQNWRPSRQDIQLGHWAPSHMEGYHWTRTVSTWDFPTLIHTHMNRWTLRDLWNYWCSMPSVTKAKTGSAKKTPQKIKQNRLQQYTTA